MRRAAETISWCTRTNGFLVLDGSNPCQKLEQWRNDRDWHYSADLNDQYSLYNLIVEEIVTDVFWMTHIFNDGGECQAAGVEYMIDSGITNEDFFFR